MDAQLRLIPRGQASTNDSRPGPHGGDEPSEAPVQWRIDDSARQRGRAGISQAREALRQARRPLPHDSHTTAA
ncbi:MAG TPA: hypothetical protein VIY72_07050 [Acidimicrobiales bacterium]